mmetsp:Transcript_74327/g.214848  ORF Transcript_74327/g.214848 Transcript_74327/m.214848 type:complete len:347 (+) Transcript_74327:27-1067(+)
MRRPSSGVSTRSRRDEVWEMKRQRFLARQGRGGGTSSAPGLGAGERQRPPPLGAAVGPGMPPPAPKSPLSRLVAEGYPQAQPPASTHMPYGERPSSRGAGARAPGFDAGVAGQWSANVKNDVARGQNRHDPTVAGPARPSGGQRVTQSSGGNASIDLSWGGGPPSAAQQHQYQQQPPPRMPSAAQFQGAAGAIHGASPSNASRDTCPWGHESGGVGSGGSRPRGSSRGRPPMQPQQQPQQHYQQQRYQPQQDQPHQYQQQQYQQYQQPQHQQQQYQQPRQRDPPPFGVDAAPAAGAGQRGPRGASPSPQQYSIANCGAGMADAAGAPRGRGGITRPPGGASSVVFG